MRLIFLMVVLLLTAVSPAVADSAAQFVTQLFIDACVPNLGQPGKVRDWAQAHRLAQIESPAALALFVGPGTNGAAWAIPAVQGSFALSIRGTTEACAVWARSADPDEVLTNFRRIMEGVKHPGIDVTVNEDKTSHGPSGKIHVLIYSVGASNARRSFLFTLLTAERPGGAFQASMQAVQTSAR